MAWRPPRGGVQPARHREHGVADLLRLEATAIEPPEQAVLRIVAHGRVSGGVGRPSPGTLDCWYVLQQDEAVNRLEPPAVLDQRRRQPVEQFRVAGSIPLVPKSLTVLTRPMPKCCCQRRLTITRAVSGCSEDDRASGPAGCAGRAGRGPVRAGGRPPARSAAGDRAIARSARRRASGRGSASGWAASFRMGRDRG